MPSKHRLTYKMWSKSTYFPSEEWSRSEYFIQEFEQFLQLYKTMIIYRFVLAMKRIFSLQAALDNAKMFKNYYMKSRINDKVV